jgi:hypothetical protein
VKRGGVTKLAKGAAQDAHSDVTVAAAAAVAIAAIAAEDEEEEIYQIVVQRLQEWHYLIQI